MIIKVCGLTIKSQIEELDHINSVNWLGFIFYSKSKRFTTSVTGNIDNSKKVGVFVNENEKEIRAIARVNKLDILQLHGDESPELCMILKSDYIIIKAFGIHESIDFQHLQSYEGKVDYFLFDTKTIHYGGSGRNFDWSVLEKYTLSIPFLLSGGLNINSVKEIKSFSHKSFAGIDLNSGFENEPGDKNCKKIKTFIKVLKQ